MRRFPAGGRAAGRGGFGGIAPQRAGGGRGLPSLPGRGPGRSRWARWRLRLRRGVGRRSPGSGPTLPDVMAWRLASREGKARGTAPRDGTARAGGSREAATERVLCGDGMPRSALARRCWRRPLPRAPRPRALPRAPRDDKTRRRRCGDGRRGTGRRRTATGGMGLRRVGASAQGASDATPSSSASHNTFFNFFSCSFFFFYYYYFFF